jgi:hypothetical protein
MRRSRGQTADIGLYCRFIRKCRKHPVLFGAVLRHAERLFWKRHRTVPRGCYYEAMMAQVGVAPAHPLSYYREELIADERLAQTISGLSNQHLNREPDENIFDRENYVANYYALIRETRPKIVIETGTAEGRLTSWVLSAMHRNGQGRLLSIDIPPKAGALTMAFSLTDDSVGCFIPEAYRDRWEYHKGDAKVLLPRLLVENDADVFIHDSLHTRTHMLFEYNCARALMRPGAVIISHDILWNKAFFCFTASHNLLGLSSICDPNLGLTVNRFDRFEEEAGVSVIKTSES